MIKNLILAACLVSTASLFGQYAGVKVEKLDNPKDAPGDTYRVYVLCENESDQIQVVYGIEGNPLTLSSDKPFFQSEFGGATAAETNHSSLELVDELKYDSWWTIGAESSDQNAIVTFRFNLTGFEERGEGIVLNDGGLLFNDIDLKQAYAGPEKKVLVGQFTTKGQVEGSFNVQIRVGGNDLDSDGLPTWQTTNQEGIKFSTKDI